MVAIHAIVSATATATATSLAVQSLIARIPAEDISTSSTPSKPTWTSMGPEEMLGSSNLDNAPPGATIIQSQITTFVRRRRDPATTSMPTPLPPPTTATEPNFDLIYPSSPHAIPEVLTVHNVNDNPFLHCKHPGCPDLTFYDYISLLPSRPTLPAVPAVPAVPVAMRREVEEGKGKKEEDLKKVV